MQFAFGSGSLYVVAGTNTPVPFAALQDVSVDFSYDTKPVYGKSQFPLTVARGKGKIDLKAKQADINGLLFSSIFFNASAALGGLLMAEKEAGTVPGVSTYIITVSHSSTFTTDLGVINAATGVPLTKVASGPTTGQYSVAAGVYTFAAADANLAVLITYAYTTSSSGSKIVITNQTMGQAPTFQANLSDIYNGQQLSLQLNACISSKLSLATKNDDFTIPEFDFSAFADAAGNIGTISVA